MRLARGSGIAAVALAALLLMPSAAFAERTLGLSSGSFRYRLDAGEQVSGSLKAINDGDQSLSVLIYAANQVFDRRGNVSYTTPSVHDDQLTSPASWIRLYLPPDSKSINNTPYINLPVGESRDIRFDVDVPAGVASGDHSIILFFETFNPKNRSTSGASVEGRMGARIKCRVSGKVVHEISVEPFEVPSFLTGNNFDYSFLLANKGNVDETITAQLAVLDRNDRTVAETLTADREIAYARTTIRKSGSLSFDPILIGRRTVRLTVSPGASAGDGPAEIVKERSIFIVSRWLLVLFVVAVILFLLRMVWRVIAGIERRRQSRERQERRRRARENENEEVHA